MKTQRYGAAITACRHGVHPDTCWTCCHARIYVEAAKSGNDELADRAARHLGGAK